MNNYFKNYLVVFFSFFVAPVFAMEIKYNSGKEIAAELIALTQLPKEKKSIHKNDLFLEQDRQDAENWFNKEAESIQPRNPEEALLNYFVKRGTNVPDADKFDSYFFAGNSQQNLQFNIQKTTEKEPVKHKQPHKLPYIKKAPLNILDIPATSAGRKKPLPEKINKKQNCLLM